MNSKKTLLQVGTIISIVAAAIMTLIYLASLPMVKSQVELYVQQQGAILSVEQIDSLVALTTLLLVVCLLFGIAVLVLAILLEVKICKNKSTKALSIALIVVDAVYAVALVVISGLTMVLGTLMFVAAAIVLLIGVCLSQGNNQAMTNPYVDNNNNTLL